MKKLEKIIKKKGFTFTLIKREGNIAMYQQRLDISDTKSSNFEVIIVGSHNGIKIADNYLPPSELYPSASQWGNTGWTYNSRENAEFKFTHLLKAKK
jgi:hypothetical protein